MVRLTVREYGDSSLQICVAGADESLRWRAIHTVSRRLNAMGHIGVLGVIPTYDTALVEFDPYVADGHAVETAILEAFSGITHDGSTPPRVFDIPVVYGGERGPDLRDVAREHGTDPEEVIGRHLAADYVIRCFSHSAAPMMDGPDSSPEVKRLGDPRISVPAGSVMLAGRQSIVLTRTQPSGWRAIGSTPVTLIGSGAQDAVPYRPGDLFRFRRILEEDWDTVSPDMIEQI